MPDQWRWYVYILECNDGSFYTGLTWNAAIRYDQHLSKFGANYTAKHGVKRLAYMEEHDDLYVARTREKQIKDWNRRKKEKLINGEWGGPNDWRK